jgi:hypothetical protein
VVPYYVANIYLVQGQKDKAIAYAEAKLKKGNQYYDAELRQLVGMAIMRNRILSRPCLTWSVCRPREEGEPGRPV